MNEIVKMTNPNRAKIIDKCFRNFFTIKKQQKMTITPIKRAIVILCVIFVIKRNVKSIEKPTVAIGLFKINTPLNLNHFF